MHISVCVTQTPDSSSVYIDPITGQVDVERFVQILNPADACAIEAAIRLKEQFGGEVTLLTLGPPDTESALRAGLALGADTATRLWCPEASNWGPFAIATVLATYIASKDSNSSGSLDSQASQASHGTPFDLILCGDASSDWSTGTVGPAIAGNLSLPQVTSVVSIEGTSTELNVIQLRVTRKLERGYRELVEADLPLLLAVTPELNEPRYPSLPAHLASLRAQVTVVDAHNFSSQISAEDNATTLLELHVPRPLPRYVAAPNSKESAFRRIGAIVSGGAMGSSTGRKTRLIDGSPEELAARLVDFLKTRGFV